MKIDGSQVPLDGLAARVTSKGTAPPKAKDYDCYHSETPPPKRPIPKINKSNFNDYAGFRTGRITVVWLTIDNNSKLTRKNCGSLWAVRCDCGAYETRRTRSLKNTNTNRTDMCQYCRGIKKLQDRYAIKRKIQREDKKMADQKIELEQFAIYKCRINIRPEYKGRPPRLDVITWQGSELNMRVLFFQDRDDQYAGEWALEPWPERGKFPVAWISEGDLDVLEVVMEQPEDMRL